MSVEHITGAEPSRVPMRAIPVFEKTATGHVARDAKPDGKARAFPETTRPESRNDTPGPVMYINRQDEVTTVMFVQSDGIVNSREFRNLPKSNRKTIVDYMIDHPDHIATNDIAPLAEIEGVATSFPMQVTQVRRDLQALCEEDLFIPQIPSNRREFWDYQLRATLIPTNASPDELLEVLGLPSPSKSLAEKRRREIDPSLPMLRVLRGEDFALAVVERGKFRNTVTIRGENQLAVFDYLTSHPKMPISSGEMAAATLPEVSSSAFAKIVDRVGNMLEAGLEKNSLVLHDIRSHNSTRTLAMNVTAVTPSDLISGDLSYERLNDPTEKTAIIAVRGTDTVLQMKSTLAKTLQSIPFGKENALDIIEIGKKIWPDKDPSELNKGTISTLIAQTKNAISNAGDQMHVAYELVNSRWIAKYYLDIVHPFEIIGTSPRGKAIIMDAATGATMEISQAAAAMITSIPVGSEHAQTNAHYANQALIDTANGEHSEHTRTPASIINEVQETLLRFRHKLSRGATGNNAAMFFANSVDADLAKENSARAKAGLAAPPEVEEVIYFTKTTKDTLIPEITPETRERPRTREYTKGSILTNNQLSNLLEEAALQTEAQNMTTPKQTTEEPADLLDPDAWDAEIDSIMDNEVSNEWQ